MNKLLVSLLLVFTVSSAFSQGTFKVLYSAGDNSYSAGEEWEKIRIGLTLDDNATIKLGEEPYLALTHSKGFNVELKHQGEFNLQEYVKGGPDNDVVKKFMDHVSSRMDDEGPSNRLQATGAVERDVSSGFDVFLPSISKKASYFGEEAVLGWEEFEGADSYTVTITNMMGDKIIEEKVEGNTLKVDLSKLSGPANILTVQTSTGEKSKSFALSPMKPAEKTSMEQDYEELVSTMDGNSAIDALVIAEFLEEKGALLDAATYYNMAVQMAPAVDLFRQEREAFALRH